MDEKEQVAFDYKKKPTTTSILNNYFKMDVKIPLLKNIRSFSDFPEFINELESLYVGAAEVFYESEKRWELTRFCLIVCMLSEQEKLRVEYNHRHYQPMSVNLAGDPPTRLMRNVVMVRGDVIKELVIAVITKYLDKHFPDAGAYVTNPDKAQDPKPRKVVQKPKRGRPPLPREVEGAWGGSAGRPDE